MHLFLLPILGLFTIRFNGYGISEVEKNKFSDRPIPEKQGRVRGNKSIFKAGLSFLQTDSEDSDQSGCGWIILLDLSHHRYHKPTQYGN